MNDVVVNNVAEALKEYLSTELLIDFSEEITENSDLFEEGLVDSFGFVELIGFIERQFSLKFTAEELMNYDFRTLASIENTILEKTSD